MPANTSLFVNQVWAEATIASSWECLDRQTIDVMNDKPEGGSEQYGWWVNENHSYVEEWFIGRFVNHERQMGEGMNGYCEIGTDFTEIGYLGTILQIDFDFYVKKDNEDYAYKFSFVDNIMFSSSGELVDAIDVEGGNADASFPLNAVITSFLFMVCLVSLLKWRSKV